MDVPSLEEIWFLSDGNEYPWDIDIRSFRGCKPKTIYCARPNAPSLYGTPSEDDMFGGLDVMKDIILYVRPECVETYRNTPNWGVMDIRPYDFQNGLPMTEADTPQNGDIQLYDLGGRPVTEANPASGIYIANGQKTVIR